MLDDLHPTRTSLLLERYLSGDRESERRLFGRHREVLLTRARSAHWMSGVSRVATPEDLVQETFLRALSAGMLRRFEDRGSGSLARALEKVLGNVVVDVYRRHGTLKRGSHLRTLSLDLSPETDFEDSPPALASADTTPTSSARGRELLDLCRNLLSPRQWEVWCQCEVHHVDAPTVAARLGTTDAAVRGLLLRARRRILRELVRREQAE